MLTSHLLSGMRSARTIARRNFGIAAPALQKASDPVQQLFLDKLREYKSKSVGGSLVDPTPEINRELQQELDKLSSQYGGGSGVDMTKFPEFKFEEPKIDPINSEQ
ncbi:CLUMA_CG008184, isoform A [Clunio marinus]|uniref:CLUMA_CG008184, isoform A n=1 Tax=Clunio marinus TaxID=568069 RepID=A0A1J1I514_9DIPT|nr:CLUMA_CG008184, isoform A [Clunio marinus]